MIANDLVDATPAQAETVIRWLKGELSEEGGFYHNRTIIRQAARNSEMKCICEGRRILGFSVFTVGTTRSKIDILEIRPNYRGRGLGLLLSTQIIEFLFSKSPRRIEVECAGDSEDFWRKLGFVTHQEKFSRWGYPQLFLESWPNNSFKPRPLRGSA